MTGAAESPSPPAASRLGALALLCCAAWLAFALAAEQRFPHLDAWRAAPAAVPAHAPASAPNDAPAGPAARDDAFTAVLVAGVVLGLLALRRPGRANLACALVALVLLAPFAADLALFPLAGASVSHGMRAGLFVGFAEALALGFGWAGWRALARDAARRRALRPETGTPAPAPAPVRVRRPPPRWLLRAGLVLLSVALGLALAEVASRALELRPYRNPVLIVPGAERRILLSEIALFRPSERPPDVDGLAARFRPYLYLKGWYDRPQWAYFDAQGCVDYVFDRWGLRDHDFELAKAKGEYRVVAIGDSFTFGVGAQLDDCWTEVLERTLREQMKRPVEVINAGFASGHNPVMYEPWIAKDGVKLQPDVLIVGFCLNDMHPGVEMYCYEVTKAAPVLGGRSVFANLVAQKFQAWEHPGRRVLDFTDRVLQQPAPWEACQAALRRSKEVLDAHGIRLLVVPFPMLTGLREPDYPYARLMAMVRDFCASARIECVDLLPDFLGQQEETLWAHPTDQHPNDKGHALIAAGIARYLAQH